MPSRLSLPRLRDRMVRFFSFKEELPIMKIICEKDLLVEAVSTVARAACAKSPVPALEGILLKAQDGQLQLLAQPDADGLKALPDKSDNDSPAEEDNVEDAKLVGK